MHQRPNRYTVYRSATTKPAAVPTKQTSGYKKYLALFCLILVCAIFGTFNASNKASARAEAELVQSTKNSQRQVFASKMASIIKNNPEVDFSVTAVAPDDGSSFHYGDASAMDAASTAKLITATYFLRQVEAGHHSLDENINGYSARYLLRQMINQSDDTAWQTLNDQLGHRALSGFAHRLGLASYDADANTINTDDIAKLLQLINSEKLMTPTHTSLLLAYMQHTNYEDFIVPATAKDASIYHKVGIDNDEVNDVAIIRKGGRSMVLAIYTNGNGTYDWKTRAQLMQQIAAAAQTAFLQ
jgi:beta-lactamase class A